MKAWTRTDKKWALWLGLAAFLLALRLCLALIIKVEINHQLAKMEGYSGHVDGVGLAFWRGAYQLRGMCIEKREGKAPIPFFSAPLMDIGIEWLPLLQGRLVSSVVISDGQLNFVNGPSQDQSQSGWGEDWLEVLKSLVPVKINRLSILRGEVHFRDPYGQPPVDLHLQGLELKAENQSLGEEGQGPVLGSVSATAKAMQGGRVTLQARLDSFAPQPTFDYSLSLEGLDLTELNPFLLRYVGMDVHAGSLNLYSEAAAADGKFKGYVKPMVRGLKVMKPHEPLLPGRLFKKALVGLFGWLFRARNDQLATRFNFEGQFKDPHTSLWEALRLLFQNAFVQALPQRLDGGAKVEDLQKKPVPSRGALAAP